MSNVRIGRWRALPVALVLAVVALGAGLAFAQGGDKDEGKSAQQKAEKPDGKKAEKPAGEKPNEPEADLLTGVDEIRPAPGAFGADVPLTYQGPPPSEVKDELIGPHELLRAGEYDLDKGTVQLPLYRGTVDGDSVWYILTDTSDPDEADSLGLNFSPKLKYTAVEAGAREATLVAGNALEFEGGSVDFGPERRVEPGDGVDAFPPSV